MAVHRQTEIAEQKNLAFYETERKMLRSLKKSMGKTSESEVVRELIQKEYQRVKKRKSR